MRDTVKRGGRKPRVVIVRDRASAGGGIYNYYQSIRGYLSEIEYQFVDIGRPHDCYGTGVSLGDRIGKITPLRLVMEWCTLALRIARGTDLVHVNPGLDIKTRRSLQRDAVSVRIAKAAGRKVLVFWRGWDNEACGTPEFPGGNDGWLARTYRQADAHLVLSADFEADLRRWGVVAPIWVETTVVPDVVLRAAPAPRKHVAGRTSLLFLSRVEVAKGVFELLEAFQILERERPGQFSLTFAGDGPAQGELQSRVQATGLKNVHLPGYVNGEAKLNCYREASIFCFPSYTEGMPNAVLEAMAMGLPLVSSLAGGLKGVLKEGDTGLALRYHLDRPMGKRFDPGEIARAILKLADDGALFEHVSVFNKCHAEKRFSAANVAGRLQSVYLKICNPSVSS